MTDKDEFVRRTGVSRETLEKFEVFEATLRKWNGTINLVARTTLDDLWGRHFLDSAGAIDEQVRHPGKWVDLGSGGGFPAIVNALIAAGRGVEAKTTCIETDIRKSEFLRTVSRATGLSISVISRRIEECPPQGAQVVSSRALARLTKLLSFMETHKAKGGVGFFHKGRGWKTELDEAQESWQFDYDVIPSQTDSEAVILKIGNLRNA